MPQSHVQTTRPTPRPSARINGDAEPDTVALQDRVAELESGLQARSRDLAHALAELELTRRSLSWRLTAPLRVAAGAVRRGRPRPRKRSASQAIGGVTRADVWVPLLESPRPLPRSEVQTVAFYLPQYHPIPENDRWWGRGFTEWTNVSRAKPLFAGHEQPRLPGELGFYDLRLPDVQRRQVELARLYGIDAFCFYAYWFHGRRLLELPLARHASDPELELPYCICWANESWTRRWDGRKSEVLLAQSHDADDDIAFIEYYARYLVDPRYLRVGDRPLLVVYRPGSMPDPRATAERWRRWMRSHHGLDLYLAFTEGIEVLDPQSIGFDAAIEFPPLRPPGREPLPEAPVPGYTPVGDSDARILDWRRVAEESERYKLPSYSLFRGVCPSWDNTPRRGTSATVLRHSSPVGFQNWLFRALRETEARAAQSERLVFVNAWNEWAEGCYLEPDARRGYGSLEAVRVASVRAGVREMTPQQEVRLGVVIHAFYPDLLARTIRRLEALERPPGVLVTTVADVRDAVESQLRDSALDAEVVTVRNLGRDVWPFLQVLSRCEELSFDVVLKLHTKVSHHRQDGDTWRDELLDELLVPEAAARIISAFEADPNLGMVGPTGHRLATTAYIGANGNLVNALGQRLGFESLDADASFFAGTMFYVRLPALAPLRAIQLSAAQFEHELGQVDGTLAHALERCFSLSVESAGFTVRATGDLDGRGVASAPIRSGYPFAETAAARR